MTNERDLYSTINITHNEYYPHHVLNCSIFVVVYMF
jgi:hypothetical protein